MNFNYGQQKTFSTARKTFITDNVKLQNELRLRRTFESNFVINFMQSIVGGERRRWKMWLVKSKHNESVPTKPTRRTPSSVVNNLLSTEFAVVSIAQVQIIELQ